MVDSQEPGYERKRRSARSEERGMNLPANLTISQFHQAVGRAPQAQEQRCHYSCRSLSSPRLRDHHFHSPTVVPPRPTQPMRCLHPVYGCCRCLPRAWNIHGTRRPHKERTMAWPRTVSCQPQFNCTHAPQPAPPQDAQSATVETDIRVAACCWCS